MTPETIKALSEAYDPRQGKRDEARNTERFDTTVANEPETR
jgi:hypothetical protein